jgi:hypothetical protein
MEHLPKIVPLDQIEPMCSPYFSLIIVPGERWQGRGYIRHAGTAKSRLDKPWRRDLLAASPLLLRKIFHRTSPEIRSDTRRTVILRAWKMFAGA